jgi:hypothetical protein
MILLSLVFILVLGLTFSVVMLLTRPSATDRAIGARLANIQTPASGIFLGEGVSEIFKPTRLSEIGWLDQLLQQWNLSHKIRLLVAQAESSWSVPVVLAISAGMRGRRICGLVLLLARVDGCDGGGPGVNVCSLRVPAHEAGTKAEAF